MIIYKNILGQLKDAGYSSYRLGREGIFGQSTLDSLRNNKNVSLEVIDKICALLDCDVEDIIEYREV